MDTRRSSLRRLTILVSLVALLIPAGAAEAAKNKKVPQPVVTSVRPMTAEVGDTLTIHGKNFRSGKGKNTVVFKRDGAKAIFAKSDVSTRKLIKVVVPESLVEFMTNQGTNKLPTMFRIRILSVRFGKGFTTARNSPKIGPKAPPAPQAPPTEAKPDGDCDGNGVKNAAQADDDADGLADDVELSLGLDPCAVDTDKDGLEDRWEFDCDRDGALNRDESDDDADLMPDSFEAGLMTDPCAKDSDGDGVEDGFEFRSAIDLNDDEYQTPNKALPYPGKRPYPNPLDGNDAKTDFDGDSLTQIEEYKLWVYTYETAKTSSRDLEKLSYSDGLQHSVYADCPNGGDPACGPNDNGRRVPNLMAAGYDRWNDFIAWAQSAGYRRVWLEDGPPWWMHSVTRKEYGILDVDRVGGEDASESYPLDMDEDGRLGDDERDEDADGLSNYDETHGRMLPKYWAACYTSEPAYQVEYAGTSHVNADSDGDGVRDGADDQDHDDIPNMMELSRMDASGGLNDTDDGLEGRVTGGNVECLPDPDLPQPPEEHHPGAYGRVSPFNPCYPANWSRTCSRHPQLGQAPVPNWWSLQ